MQSADSLLVYPNLISPPTDCIHGVTVWFKSLAVNWSVRTQLDEARYSHWSGACDLLPPLSSSSGIFSTALTMDWSIKKRNKGKTRARSWEEFRSWVTPPFVLLSCKNHLASSPPSLCLEMCR